MSKHRFLAAVRKEHILHCYSEQHLNPLVEQSWSANCKTGFSCIAESSLSHPLWLNRFLRHWIVAFWCSRAILLHSAWHTCDQDAFSLEVCHRISLLEHLGTRVPRLSSRMCILRFQRGWNCRRTTKLDHKSYNYSSWMAKTCRTWTFNCAEFIRNVYHSILCLWLCHQSFHNWFSFLSHWWIGYRCITYL